MQQLKQITFSVFILLTIAQSGWSQTESYRQQIEKWHQQRIEALRAENGWLNLIGLYWLQEGENSFGSDASNAVVFPNAAAPKVGSFIRKGNQVTLKVLDGNDVQVNKVSVKDAVIFHPDSSKQAYCGYQQLRWTIIKRGEKLGVRLRDLQSSLLLNFKDTERFAVNSSWKFSGKLIADTAKEILITNVLGQTTAQPSPGKIQFSYKGKTYSLAALKEGDAFFIIFADATSGEQTYPSGRFLLADAPDANGNIEIDFNKAYNPPCAFTKYATCPLPPKENSLPFAVKAGEKYKH